MRCTKAAYQLQCYIDHRLTLRQTRLLEAHVASCSACQARLCQLEEVTCDLHTLKLISEPADLHEQIMHKVALTATHQQVLQTEKRFAHFRLFRPSLTEICVAIVLATVATLATLLQQPSVSVLFPLSTEHDFFSLLYVYITRVLSNIDTNMLILALWIVGTLLGVCITLVVAGSEMRTQWLKAMMDRLPVR